MRGSEHGTADGGQVPQSRAEAQRSTELDAAQLQALADLPSGAVTVAGVAVVLLLIGWLLVYLMVYLPRGMVG
jgi:hypothetical protein